jgi:hypothetical protein
MSTTHAKPQHRTACACDMQESQQQMDKSAVCGAGCNQYNLTAVQRSCGCQYTRLVPRLVPILLQPGCGKLVDDKHDMHEDSSQPSTNNTDITHEPNPPHPQRPPWRRVALSWCDLRQHVLCELCLEGCSPLNVCNTHCWVLPWVDVVQRQQPVLTCRHKIYVGN